MLSREARKESRKRGSARRVIDLEDFVFEAPPVGSSQSQSQSKSQSRSQSQTQSQSLSPSQSQAQVRKSPRFNRTLTGIPKPLSLNVEFNKKAKENKSSLSKNSKSKSKSKEDNLIHHNISNNNIVDNNDYQDTYREVLHSKPESQELPHDYEDFIRKSEERILSKHKQLIKSHQNVKIQKNSNKNVKNKITKNKSKKSRAIEKSRSKSIQIKYRRIPTNKTKLLAIDVISQIFEDYFSNQNNLNKVIYKFNQKNSNKKMDELIIKLSFKKFFKDYREKVSAYFADLIDLQLSNNLILNDLNKVNSEKNKIRLDIFNIREERNINSLELKDLRNKFLKMRESYGLKAKMYKELLELQKIKSNYNDMEDGKENEHDDGNENENGNHKNLEGLIEWKLNHLRNIFNSKNGLINKLKDVNELLRNLYENI